MIKKIEIHNIQSHENTVLELSNGINAIVGSSNNGKTAILRALNWLRYYRPLGIDTLASHWIVDDKGNLTKEMSVMIENDKGTIIRQRTKDNNQYIIGDKVLSAVKSDVPDEVVDMLNLSETSIQNQQDAPFLLSLSGGEVAKYFNRVVRLDVIDKVLSNAESLRRKTKSDIESVEKIIKEQEAKKDKYFWLDSVKDYLDEYENISAKQNVLLPVIDSIEKDMDALIRQQKIVLDFQAVLLHKEKINGIERLLNEIKKNEVVADELRDSLIDFNSLKNKLDFLSEAEKGKELILEMDALLEKNSDLEYSIQDISLNLHRYKENINIGTFDFTKQKQIIERILNWKDTSKQKVNELEKSLYDFKIQKMHIENSEKDIECLKEQLPDICPICGNPLK